MNDLDDPIIASLHKHINAIAEMCNERIKPWEQDAGPRAVRLFNELAAPYINRMCEYVATRPKAAFQIPVFKFDGKLYPITTVPD